MRKNINDLRKEIDKLDDELINLLAKRMSASKEIGVYKKTHNLPPIDQKRWQKVIDQAIAKGTIQKVPSSFTEQLYALIHTYSLRLQQTPHAKRIIGIQGGMGSFNEQAALSFIKTNNFTNYELKYLYTTENVLKALNQGVIDRGVFAIHNTLGGIVDESVKAVAKYPFSFVESTKLPIAHALMIRKDVTMSEITTIMGHPQAQIQCKKTLAKKYPKLSLKVGEGDLIDHALVAKYLSEGKLSKNIATLGPKQLAEIYDLQIIEENLQDSKDNYSTFLIVEPKDNTV